MSSSRYRDKKTTIFKESLIIIRDLNDFEIIFLKNFCLYFLLTFKNIKQLLISIRI